LLILVEFRTRVTSTRFTIGGFPREQEVQTARRHRYEALPSARKKFSKTVLRENKHLTIASLEARCFLDLRNEVFSLADMPTAAMFW
jgi:hypothetical protein